MTATGIPHAASACIDACLHCYRTCLQTAMNHCLETGGRHVEPSHFRLITNCAQMCRTTADFMLSSSHLHGRICAACAEVCGACADSCEQIGEMDECVRACRECEQSCRRMANGQLYGDVGERASHAGAGQQGQLLM
ncbi:MAG TPA: four-helix bundle copper-binding protein [Noviherbaspirillum sp.]|nr:four-helix bundle copper-binding protein [Noviherbaspirillum sp.]